MNKCEDVVSTIIASEDIIKIIFAAYRQGLIFKRFKEKYNFITMIKDFDVVKSTMNFEMNIMKLLDKYKKLKNLAISLHFMMNYFKAIKEICKENTTKFK